MIRRSLLTAYLAGVGAALASLIAMVATGALLIGDAMSPGILLVAGLVIVAVLLGMALRRDSVPPNHVPGQILDSLPGGVVQCDANGKIVFVNQAATQLLGGEAVLHAPLVSRLALVDRETRTPLTPGLWAEMQQGLRVPVPAGACLISSDGMEFEVEGETVPLASFSGQAGSVLILRDVTEDRNNQRLQPGLTETDPATGLPVAKVLIDRLERNLLSKRAVDRELSYLHIELDGLAQVRTEAGQTAANQLMREAGRVMLSRLRDTDTLARVDDQAFGLLLPACPQEVSERIQRTLEDSLQAMAFTWQGQTYPITARIGTVHAPPFAGTYDECQALALEAATRKAG